METTPKATKLPVGGAAGSGKAAALLAAFAAACGSLVPCQARARDVFFSEDTGVFRNPGQGWSASKGSFARAESLVNVGAVYARFHWAELQPEEGRFNWTPLDETIAFAASKGLPASFRVMCVNRHNTNGEETPQWVFDKGAAYEPFTAPATIGGVETNLLHLAPVFDDPVFMSAHSNFIAALAARYDGDPRLAGLDLGSYGHWGEWHCYGLPPNTNGYLSAEVSAQVPYAPPHEYPLAVRRQYADWYLNGFRETPLVFMTDDAETLKYAIGEQGPSRVGLRRDGVGSPSHFQRWIGTSSYASITRMADVWRDRSVWFEFFCDCQELKARGWSLPQSVEWMLTNHVTVVNATPFNPWNVGDDPASFALLREIDLYAGARLVPTHAVVERDGRRVSVQLAGVNRGVARLHLPYALQFVVSDGTGVERLVHESSADPGGWLPGEFSVSESFDLPAALDGVPQRLFVRLRHRGGVFRDFRFAALESADDCSLTLDWTAADDKDWFFAKPDGYGASALLNGYWSAPPAAVSGDRFSVGAKTGFSLADGAIAAGTGRFVRAECRVSFERFISAEAPMLLPSLDESLAALTPVTNSAGEALWMGYAGGAWTVLGGAEPPILGTPYVVRMEGDFTRVQPRVRLSVSSDGGASFSRLSDPSGSRWLAPSQAGKTSLSGVDFGDAGEMFFLRGRLLPDPCVMFIFLR